MILPLLRALALPPDCGRVGLGPARPGELDRIDLASYAVVRRLLASDGAADTEVFAEPLASRLRADEAPKDWLTGGGALEAGRITGLRVLTAAA